MMSRTRVTWMISAWRPPAWVSRAARACTGHRWCPAPPACCGSRCKSNLWEECWRSAPDRDAPWPPWSGSQSSRRGWWRSPPGSASCGRAWASPWPGPCTEGRGRSPQDWRIGRGNPGERRERWRMCPGHFVSPESGFGIYWDPSALTSSVSHRTADTFSDKWDVWVNTRIFVEIYVAVDSNCLWPVLSRLWSDLRRRHWASTKG